MFRRHYKKRSTFLPFVILRLFLSLMIFATLIGGAYYAYREFSGFDPVKLNHQATITLLFKELSKALNSNISNIKTPVNTKTNLQGAQATPVQRKFAFKFAIVSDSHSDNHNLEKALQDREVQFVIGLGDYTEVGTIAELEVAKKAFDEGGIRYFLTAGDHDLWDSRNRQKDPRENFAKVFGQSYQGFSFEGVRFIVLNNSDNYNGLEKEQFEFLKQEQTKVRTEKPKLVLAFLHEPLYHPSSTRVMGKVTPQLRTQAKEVLKILKEVGVKEVFAGDIHYFTKYKDPETGISMTTVGALTSQRNTQNPRYVIVSVYEDGSYEVLDVEILL